MKGPHTNHSHPAGSLVKVKRDQIGGSRKGGYGIVLDHSNHDTMKIGISREGKTLGDYQDRPHWANHCFTQIVALPGVII